MPNYYKTHNLYFATNHNLVQLCFFPPTPKQDSLDEGSSVLIYIQALAPYIKLLLQAIFVDNSILHSFIQFKASCVCWQWSWKKLLPSYQVQITYLVKELPCWQYLCYCRILRRNILLVLLAILWIGLLYHQPVHAYIGLWHCWEVVLEPPSLSWILSTFSWKHLWCHLSLVRWWFYLVFATQNTALSEAHKALRSVCKILSISQHLNLMLILSKNTLCFCIFSSFVCNHHLSFDSCIGSLATPTFPQIIECGFSTSPSMMAAKLSSVHEGS